MLSFKPKIIIGIDITNLLKTRATLDRFKKLTTEEGQVATVQTFVCCYELAWKTIKRILATQGMTEIISPRDALREGARKNLIGDPELWFEFIKKRNTASHTYNQNNIDEILEIIPSFCQALDQLINNLNNLDNR